MITIIIYFHNKGNLFSILIFFQENVFENVCEMLPILAGLNLLLNYHSG